MRCVIVDDEAPARAELRFFIENASRLDIVEEFDNALDALNYLGDNTVECLFLDIQMPNLDGIALTKVLNQMTSQPDIIFVTAHQEYAVEAFEVEAFDYVLKPYSEARIIKTLKRLEEHLNIDQTSDKITLWKEEKMMVVPVNDILYCKASERNTLVVTSDYTYTVSSKIIDFIAKLPSDLFFRSHRSYVININHIDEIVPWFNNTYVVKFKGIEEEVPVSRNNIKEFRRIMNI